MKKNILTTMSINLKLASFEVISTIFFDTSNQLCFQSPFDRLLRLLFVANEEKLPVGLECRLSLFWLKDLNITLKVKRAVAGA